MGRKITANTAAQKTGIKKPKTRPMNAAVVRTRSAKKNPF
jgi:hypothetical protein